MEKNFEYQNRKFQLRKLNAFKQLHIVRRVSPLLKDLIPAIQKSGLLSKGKLSLKDIEKLSESEKLDQIAKFLSPIFEGFSKLTDEDTEIVLLGLLEGVEVQQSHGNWAMIVRDKNLMIEDFSLKEMITLASRSFAYNLESFFEGLPQA